MLALALVACGSSGSPAPADAVAPDGRSYPGDSDSYDARHDSAHLSVDAGVDALLALHDARSDAPVDSSTGTPVLADASTDTSFDAPSRPDSAPPPACSTSRNVFTLTKSSPGGPLGSLPTATLTNLDALWSVGTSPFDITATPGSGASASLSFSLPSGTLLTPGTYPQGASHPDGGPVAELSYAGNECEPASGTVTVTTLATDDAGVTSLLATFSLACAVGPGQTDEVSGCVRYQSQTASPDASVVPPEPGYDAGLGADAAASPLAPCLGDPQAFYVSGIPLTAAPELITGAQGDWSGGQEGVVTLTAQSNARWSLALGAPGETTVSPGATYTGAGNLPSATAPYFSLLANGVDCDSPSARFTVYDYADTGGDEATVTHVSASFTATCTANGSTGTVHRVRPLRRMSGGVSSCPLGQRLVPLPSGCRNPVVSAGIRRTFRSGSSPSLSCVQRGWPPDRKGRRWTRGSARADCCASPPHPSKPASARFALRRDVRISRGGAPRRRRVARDTRSFPRTVGGSAWPTRSFEHRG